MYTTNHTYRDCTISVSTWDVLGENRYGSCYCLEGPGCVSTQMPTEQMGDHFGGHEAAKQAAIVHAESYIDGVLGE